MTNFLNSIFMLERGFAILVYSFEWNETLKNKYSSTFKKNSNKFQYAGKFEWKATNYWNPIVENYAILKLYQ